VLLQTSLDAEAKLPVIKALTTLATQGEAFVWIFVDFLIEKARNEMVAKSPAMMSVLYTLVADKHKEVQVTAQALLTLLGKN
jgi:hypothetical protein